MSEISVTVSSNNVSVTPTQSNNPSVEILGVGRGAEGVSGYSGYSGLSGTGPTGISGYSGTSGYSGYSGI